jgi:hypothetical protein
MQLVQFVLSGILISVCEGEPLGHLGYLGYQRATAATSIYPISTSHILIHTQIHTQSPYPDPHRPFFGGVRHHYLTAAGSSKRARLS